MPRKPASGLFLGMFERIPAPQIFPACSPRTVVSSRPTLCADLANGVDGLARLESPVHEFWTASSAAGGILSADTELALGPSVSYLNRAARRLRRRDRRLAKNRAEQNNSTAASVEKCELNLGQTAADRDFIHVWRPCSGMYTESIIFAIPH